MYAITPCSGSAQEITPSGLVGPGMPTPDGGIRLPVCWVHVPAPDGFSSHSWPALSSRKLPVTGSHTRLPRWMPTAVPDGAFGIGVKLPSALRRHNRVGASLPPPYTATFLRALYSITL